MPPPFLFTIAFKVSLYTKRNKMISIKFWKKKKQFEQDNLLWFSLLEFTWTPSHNMDFFLIKINICKRLGNGFTFCSVLVLVQFFLVIVATSSEIYSVVRCEVCQNIRKFTYPSYLHIWPYLHIQPYLYLLSRKDPSK